MSRKDYTLYGLSIVSDFELPEIRENHPGSTPDVKIVQSAVPERLENASTLDGYMDYVGPSCLYRIPEIGRYLIEDGHRIAIDPEPDADPKDVRSFLFGSIFGTLLHQRKMIPMHVSGIATPSGIVAFTGDSGAGKSTLAATMNKITGWPVLCDDVAVLTEEDGAPVLESGMLRLKLWRDALERLEHDPARVHQDATRHDKYHLNASELVADGKAPMTALVVLHRGDSIEIKRLSKAQSCAALLNAIYRPYLVPMFSKPEMIAQTMFRVMHRVDVYSFTRPWSEAELVPSAEVLRRHFG